LLGAGFIYKVEGAAQVSLSNPLILTRILISSIPNLIHSFKLPDSVYFIMHTSVSKIVAFGLFISAPLASAYAIPSQSQDLTKKDEVNFPDRTR
jgi:hypothetical protein